MQLSFCILLLVAPFGVNTASTQCPGIKSICDPSMNSVLYPVSYAAFDTYAGKVFTVGQYLIIVAKFAEETCMLPQPKKIGNPLCKPLLTISLNITNGPYLGSCFVVEAASSVNDVQSLYSISFSDDSTLHSVVGADADTYWNHWAFPVAILPGMQSDHIRVLSLEIPPACDVPNWAKFYHKNLIPTVNELLTPFVSVDTVRPSIMNVFTAKPPGNYSEGDTIYINIEFSRDVQFSILPDPFSSAYLDAIAAGQLPANVPYIELNSLAFAPLSGYTDAQRKSALQFLYRVGSGEYTSPGESLEIALNTHLELNGATITGLQTGLDADLRFMPAPGTPGSLTPAGSSNIIIIERSGDKSWGAVSYFLERSKQRAS